MNVPGRRRAAGISRVNTSPEPTRQITPMKIMAPDVKDYRDTPQSHACNLGASAASVTEAANARMRSQAIGDQWMLCYPTL